MRQTLMVVLLLVTMVTVAMPAIAADGAATMIAPPAIFMPAGGKVVTEINVSDDDVLGIIKQAIPAVADVAKELGSSAMAGGGREMSAMIAMAGAVDVQGLSEAIVGITNVRLLAVRYARPMAPEKFVEEFTAGAAKAGQFNKIVTDFGMFPGALGIYALPANGGCMGFVYLPDQRTVYAVRVVGGVDVPKLIKWGGSIAKLALTSRMQVVPEAAAQPNSAEPPAAVEEK